MNQRLQGMLAGVLIGALCAGGAVYAKTGTETIDVTYDNIKIFMDGEEVQPKDANGQTVEPFIYKGTTYLPVRAVGNAIGKEVNWDGINKVVYLGAKPGNVENWLDICGPYQYHRGEEYRLVDNSYFTMSGKKYTNGFVLDTGAISANSSQTAEALFNLDGKYDSLSFTVGHIDSSEGGQHNCNATLNIYLDGIIAYNTVLHYDDVAKKITVPLDGALQMKIEISSIDCDDGYGYRTYGFSEGEFR